jgi:hypothetical protein
MTHECLLKDEKQLDGLHGRRERDWCSGIKQLVWLSTARGVAWSLQNSEQEVCDNFLMLLFKFV